MCLPPYIVFCALNANVSAHGSLTSALIANIVLLISHHYSMTVHAQTPCTNAGDGSE
jgi:hypothetical protein